MLRLRRGQPALLPDPQHLAPVRAAVRPDRGSVPGRLSRRDPRYSTGVRQIWITKSGPPEVLQVREMQDPEAGEGQVRLRTRAVGVSFVDLLLRTGVYPGGPRPPCVAGYEVAGTIDQVGPGVSGLAPGDHVFALPDLGGYTDTLVVDAALVYRMPPAMSFEEAAALALNYLTAHHLMLYNVTLRRGSKVLIHSAAGGVGFAAVQIARSRGCVIFGTASPSKHDWLRAQGVQHPIDSRGHPAQAVRAITGAEGVDLILDPQGGRSWKQSYALLAPNGRLCMFGLQAALPGKRRSIRKALPVLLAVPKFSPMSLIAGNRTVSGTNLANLFDRPQVFREQFESLVKMYEAGEIRPHIDRVFAFEDAPAAHHYLHDRNARGKVILAPRVSSPG
jgi:synaptic vesicle membrane protein VAT-1